MALDGALRKMFILVDQLDSSVKVESEVPSFMTQLYDYVRLAGCQVAASWWGVGASLCRLWLVVAEGLHFCCCYSIPEGRDISPGSAACNRLKPYSYLEGSSYEDTRCYC